MTRTAAQPPAARRWATVAFIAVAAAVAVVLWTRPTVIRGEAAAATLMELARKQPGLVRVERAECDPRTVVTPAGATLQCTLFAPGEEAHFEVRYDRDGRIQGKPIAARTAP